MIDELPLLPKDMPWETAQLKLEGLGLGDGLPLVPPTLDRYNEMLAGHGNPERSFGFLMPLMGEISLKAIAYNCILAGCYPAELPVVLAVARACTEKKFNLLGILSTTGTPTVAVCVHGPIAVQLGMNGGSNTLGPGNRANACIGRAVSLVMRNIAGAKPGITDMATMGQPGKYTFCFVEQSHPSFLTLPERRGFDASDSCVTVFGVSGTDEVLPRAGGPSAESILKPIAAAMNAAIDVSSLNRKLERNEQVFLIPPEMADVLANDSWNLERLQSYLLNARRGYVYDGEKEIDDRPMAPKAEDIHPIVTGGVGIKMTYLPLWAGGTRTVTQVIHDL